MAKQSYGLRKLVVGYQGLFDFDGLYKMIINFFLKRHYDVEYERYKHKEGSVLGDEVEVYLKPDKKVSEYVKYMHDISWMNYDAHEVEVLRNGKTVKLTWSRFKFEVKGHIIIDWQDLGKRNKKLQGFFDEHVVKREITEVFEPTLMFETQELIDEIKEFLNMEVTRMKKEAV